MTMLHGIEYRLLSYGSVGRRKVAYLQKRAILFGSKTFRKSFFKRKIMYLKHSKTRGEI